LLIIVLLIVLLLLIILTMVVLRGIDVIIIFGPVGAVETIVDGLVVYWLIKRVILVNNHIIVAPILYVLYLTVAQLILVSVENETLHLKIQKFVIIAVNYECLNDTCILLI